MQPMITYAQRDLALVSERLMKAIDTLPEDALNWRPGDETTNSLAQIIRHVAKGQGMLLGVAVGGMPPMTAEQAQAVASDPRVRGLHNDPATHDELRGLLQKMDSRRQDALAKLADADLGEEIPTPFGPAPRVRIIGGAIGESREHLGHAELTVQLWQHGKR